MEDDRKDRSDPSEEEAKKIESNKSMEPLVTYSGSKKISFSNSLEEAEESQIRYWAGLSPEQRFSDFYELMSRFIVSVNLTGQKRR